jgi:hypothetical protein
MIKTLESPAACEQRTKRTVGNPSVELEGKIQLARMRKAGAKELARGCLEEERKEMSTAGGKGEVTGGMFELRDWMRALRTLTTAVCPEPEYVSFLFPFFPFAEFLFADRPSPTFVHNSTHLSSFLLLPLLQS